MKPAAEITVTARPYRVAFVIEDGESVHAWLDAAFAESFGRHGGRQSLVVPLMNGQVPEPYIEWLKVFDPDLVYLVTGKNEEVAGLLERYCCPMRMQSVKRYLTAEDRSPRFQMRNPALTSLSWLPFLKVTSGGYRARPEIILDCYPKWQDDGLITDNFGTLHAAFDRFPLRELAEIVRPLMLTPKDAPEDRWRWQIEGDEVNDGYEALDFLTKSGSTISLAYLSNIHSKHVSVRSHHWTNSFCLVIGDSFIDRVSCWNAGLLFDDAQQQAYKTLRLPASIWQDAEKIERIKKFINGNNWISQSGGQAKVTVRSSSLTEAQLKEFASLVGGKGSWCSYQVAAIKSIEECCPRPPNNRESAWMHSSADGVEIKVPLRHAAESVPVPRPLQVEQAPWAHPIYSSGDWIAQFNVDRTSDNNRFENERDVWQLPRRNQLTRLFLGNKEARITSGGSLALPVDKSTDRVQIREPKDEDFFHWLLHEPAVYSYPDIRYSRDRPEMPYRVSRPSDKGRYFQGVLGMFGSIHRAYDVLTHGFWRRQFAKLGSPSEDQYPQIVRTLKKRFPPQGPGVGKYAFEREDQWEKLARTFVGQAMNMRQPKHTIKLRTLKAEWRVDLERAIESDPNLRERKEEILAERPEEVTESLDTLCREGVFHQGYSWLCRHCAYRNWTALDALRMTLECQVCHVEHNTPIDLEFEFRMNEFLATCLREHDTLSVIWALGELGHRADSFIFAPQTELFRKWPEDQNGLADREIDLLCVLDGKVVLGEVKASLSQIDNAELDNLVAVARDLRPDIVVIAAMEGEKASLDAKLATIRNRLAVGVELRGLLGTKGEDLEFHLP